MQISLPRTFWPLVYVIGLIITTVSCGSNSSGPDTNKLEIVSVVPDSGMVGDTVDIGGTGGFDEELSQNILTFNGIPAEIISATTDQLITKVPQQATSGRLTLQVGNDAVTGPHFKIVSTAPIITGVAPDNASPGTQIQIKGKHFLSGTVSKDRVPRKSKAQRALNGEGNNDPAGINIKEEKNKTGAINTISSKERKGNTKSATANSMKAEANITIYFNGIIAPVLSATDTLLLTEVPKKAKSGTITVNSGDKTARWEEFKITPSLQITEVSPRSGTTGISVTINGDGFNTTSDSNKVTFNGTGANITSANNTKLIATVPNGATNGPVTVQTHGQTATGPTFTVTETTPPQVEINSISPKTGPVGTKVTITGQNFSSTTTENMVTFNGTKATVISASPTEIMTSVPNNATTGAVKLHANGQTATGPSFNVTENNPPKFTSAQTTYNSAENSAVATTLVAIDPDGDAINYKLNGGADSGSFLINSSSGELRFASAPDYEAPTDSNADNIYEVQIQASDGDLNSTKDLQLTVTNEQEAPVFLGGRIEEDSNIYVAANPGFTFDTLFDQTDLSSVTEFTIIIDESVDPLVSASTSGADGSLFSVKSIDGGRTIRFTGPTLDYTHSASGNDHQYEFAVTAQNESGQTSSRTFIIPVKPFSGGDGSTVNPYEVSSVLQLQRVGQYLDSHFQQTQDIDASATQGWNNGKGFDRIGNDYSNPFSGSYDGGGYQIMNLTIDRSNTDYIGLFGVAIGGSEITDVHLTGVNISGATNTGALVGRSSATITKSSVSGSVTTSESGSGGFVGGNWGDISDSYSTASVCCDSVAGLVGINFGSIKRSYAAGNVSGTFSEGLLRTQGASGTLSNSYWDTQATGQSSSAAGTGLTTSQIQGSAAETNLTGFDFTNVWQTNPGDYPSLRKKN